MICSDKESKEAFLLEKKKGKKEAACKDCVLLKIGIFAMVSLGKAHQQHTEASVLSAVKPNFQRYREETVVGRIAVHLSSEEELISGSQQPAWLLQELFCDLKLKIASLSWD